MIKISIVTVTYNAGNTLEESILSTINQSYKNIEYIIVDGGSQDNTLKIIRKYENRITKWVSERDNGIYDAMNKALDYASGDYLVFIGCDDHFLSYNTIENVARFITDKDCVYYGNVFRNSRNDIYKGHFNKFKISLENICHQSIFYPKSVYKSYRYNLKYRVYADYFYNLTIFPKFKFIYIPVTICYYNYEGFSSVSRDLAFERDVDLYVMKQNGLIAYLLRKTYLFYKKIR